MDDVELDRQIRSLNNGSQQLDNILSMGRTDSGATDVPQKQDESMQSPGHICNDLGTGHSKNVKTSMAAREMKTHTSSGSTLAAEK
ncbi:unnamed protein product [Arabis nemorensis]|uniref:Uncharacterized protein n=1 Tax=Arabis nemorensis TaxID=586526 RepID=A0A565BV22_9BRAS|nr:unnamed protein product [Arabis nemorensis]